MRDERQRETETCYSKAKKEARDKEDSDGREKSSQSIDYLVLHHSDATTYYRVEIQRKRETGRRDMKYDFHFAVHI